MTSDTEDFSEDFSEDFYSKDSVNFISTLKTPRVLKSKTPFILKTPFTERELQQEQKQVQKNVSKISE